MCTCLKNDCCYGGFFSYSETSGFNAQVMVELNMNKRLLVVAAAAISIAMSGIASAATQINGAVSIASNIASFVKGPPISITFGSLGSVTATSGDFTGVIGASCTACVTFPTSPFSQTTPLPVVVFQAVNGGTATATLNTAAFTFAVVNGLNTLTIAGDGTVALTGFVTTPMSFVLTANQAGSTFSMSASAIANPVPIPGALPLFASGVVGLWALGRRRKKQKQLQSLAA
jgi:hypothetical protein